ncbi:MAG: hypothetical protein AAF721_27345 [Myxococcota bacterium]
MRRPSLGRGLFVAVLAAGSLMSGCSAWSVAPAATQSPMVATAPVDNRAPDAAVEATTLPVADLVMPQVDGCHGDESTADDSRCPDEVVVAAALSWLGKTTAIYNGVEMELVEHDPELVRAEAEQDVAFRQMLAAADAAPRDGRLDGAEARQLEEQVLSRLDARLAAR